MRLREYKFCAVDGGGAEGAENRIVTKNGELLDGCFRSNKAKIV